MCYFRLETRLQYQSIALYNSEYCLVLFTVICASVILQFLCLILSLSLRFFASLWLISLSHKLFVIFVLNFSETFPLSHLSTIYYVAKGSKAKKPFSNLDHHCHCHSPLIIKHCTKFHKDISKCKCNRNHNMLAQPTSKLHSISVPTLVFDIHW